MLEYKTNDKVWFTADQHFGHENIIKYCNRPFETVEEMDQVMIDRWNEVVGEDDVVFHLGDLTLGDDGEKYFSRLNGKINILALRWHHDKRWLKDISWCNGMKWVIDYFEPLVVIYLVDLREDRPFPITLSHYPMAEWEASHYNTWHLHGHSHGHHEPDPRRPFVLDVGVDCWNFYPVSLSSIIERMFEMGWQR